VFYRFTLTAPEIVYADTIGATWDTALFFQTSTGTNDHQRANLTNGADLQRRRRPLGLLHRDASRR
jgi:hypothetical protein